jgi:hypothetical protein
MRAGRASENRKSGGVADGLVTQKVCWPWSDRWGNIVMSPPLRSRDAEYQTEIGVLLRQLIRGGLSVVECPIQTNEGVKPTDVALGIACAPPFEAE